MAYIAFEVVEADNSIKTVTDLTVPANATHALLQASEADIRYIMSSATPPGNPAENTGQVLVTSNPPELFLIEDVNNIRFHRGSATSGRLQIHYIAGRDV